MLVRNVASVALFGALLVASSIATATPARAADRIVSPMGGNDQAGCRSVHAVLAKRVIVDCPADQGFDFCFTREVVDQAGVLTGRLEFFTDSSGDAKVQHAPDQVLYNGVTNIVTASGIVRIEESGVFDTTSKDWVGLSKISGGTGQFEGATGNLASFGNAKGTGLEIGTICKK
ncbi:MAG: hypothetical protein QNJ92_05560 [Alphaproteobacteria bacterium]|nr:hypothetical protein [Alphaproteobacteria bacterium]